MDALAFLASKPLPPGPLYIVHGDEAFLRRQAVHALRRRALGEGEDDQAFSLYQGDKAVFADVFDELETVPFFYPRRVVIVENADPFVTRYRTELESKLKQLPASGMLLLEVKTWAANTRLAKMVDNAATIACKPLAGHRLPAWCSEWCASQYQKQLPVTAANLLVDHVGDDMGLLDQELLKLSVYVGSRAKIEASDVDRLVGNNRAENIWKIFDAIAVGNLPQALAILHRSFEQGEEPLRMMGAFSMQLRRLAQAAQWSGQGLALGAALERAGVAPFHVRSAEQQMRHLGRRRLESLYEWLLQINLDLRGNSLLPARTLMERFLLKLARKNDEASQSKP